MNNILEKDLPNFNTFEDIWHLLWSFFATNKKITITHLWHAIEPQTMYHFIAKDKVAEQHIWRKSSSCNGFWVMSPLLKVANIAIAHLPLGLCPQSQQNFRGRENSRGLLIYEKNL